MSQILGNYRWVLAVWAFAIWGEWVQGHFLFIRLLPPAEGGRAAEVYFSELAEAGDPRFIDKIAQTRLWLQQTPGQFEPLTVHKAEDRLRAPAPSQGSLAVIGDCTYGVLARPKRVPFLLRHFPKAIAGRPEDIHTFKPRPEVPLEILARLDGDALEITALRKGKPIPKAEFETLAADLSGKKLQAGADGKVRWKPPRTGFFAVYTSNFYKEKGSYQGQDYEEIREFATLTFSWPLERQGADAGAVTLFQEALSFRASWKNFPGFTAVVKARIDGRPWNGKVTVSSKGDVEVEEDDEVVGPWVKEQLESLALHRLARAQGKESPILRFADQDKEHPFGRLLIFEGGQFASSYRVKDQQILVVNRNLGKVNMTITVLENEKNLEGKFLPHTYTVHYWNAKDGTLQRTETIQEDWIRVGSFDLPTRHIVTQSSSAGISVRNFTLSDHRLLKKS